MIKIVYSEVESPTEPGLATDLGQTTAVRAVNTSPKAIALYVMDVEKRVTKSITLAGGESLILKKSTNERVYSLSKLVRIAGVSIY